MSYPPAGPPGPTNTGLPADRNPADGFPRQTDPAYAEVDDLHESGSSTADTAKDEAANVKDTALDAGKNVAATAKDEVGNVATETADQAKGLLSSVTSQVKDQASTQQGNLATAVHGWSGELGSMASASKESGPLTDLAHQAARKGGEIAHFLDDKEPSDVLAEVTAFARRRPVAFLALCGLGGVLAGRLTRGAVATNTKVDSPKPDTSELTTGRRVMAPGPDFTSVTADLEPAPGTVMADDPYDRTGLVR